MDIKRAIEIINDNYNTAEGSLMHSMWEKDLFVKEQFWEFYDSLCRVVKASMYNYDLTEKISVSYQNILKILVYHHDFYDLCKIKELPEEYTEYIERLDDAVLAYYRRDPRLIKHEEAYALKRPEGD